MVRGASDPIDDDVIAALIETSKSSVMLTDKGMYRAKLLASLLEVHLDRSARSFVASTEGRPLLYSIASDGTDAITRVHVSTRCGSAVVRRSGKEGGEVLLQHAFLAGYDTKGDIGVRFLAKRAKPLSRKTQWHLFQELKAFFLCPLCWVTRETIGGM